MDRNKDTRILIVEDNIIVAQDLKSRVENMGYTVLSCVISGEAAIESVKENKPDLILMDIKLKGDLNGIETYAIIGEKINAPVIYITSYTDEETLSRAKLTQPLGYIVKPFDDEDLRTTIVIALHQYQMDQALKESRQQYHRVVNTIGDALIIASMDNRIQYVNKAFSDIYLYAKEEVIGMSVLKLIHPDHRNNHKRFIQDLEAVGRFIGSTIDLRKDGTKFYTDVRGAKIQYKGENCYLTVIRDITRQMKYEAALIAERNKLQKALEDIKKLSGMLPICTKCKKIRDDQGYWNQIESYISEHSEAVFSHSLCDGCMEKYYPDDMDFLDDEG